MKQKSTGGKKGGLTGRLLLLLGLVRDGQVKSCFYGVLVSCVAFYACGVRSSKQVQVFHYNEYSGIATLDPAFAKSQSVIWVVHQLYSTLLEMDDQLKPAPLLARSWDVSADRLTYRFHLRQDVYFHDNDAFPRGSGRRLTAADVVYSFQRIVDKRTASSGAWIFHDRIDPVQPFEAIDDSTFELKLAKPFNPVLGLLSMQYCSIVPKEVVEKWGKDFRNHPCGTGPFRFTAWEEGQALVMAKNGRYFEKDSAGRQLPYLDAIKIGFNNNRATEFLLFQQGELDFLNDIDVSFKDEVLDKRGILKRAWEGKIVLSKHPYLNTEYLGFLVDPSNPLIQGSPLRNKKIRQAINYAIDRKKLMLYLRNSIGTPAESGFVPAGLPSFDPAKVKGYTYDPAKARQLLQESGYRPEGPVVKLLTIPNYAEFANFIAGQLHEAGIRVQVEVLQKSLLLEETAKSEAPFFRGSWIADYPDAENYLSVFYSKNPAPPNYTRYKNPRFDALYEKALTENREEEKLRMYQEMDQLVMEDAPVVPLWYDQVLRLVQPRVRNFVPNGLNLLELRKVYIQP
ncbi:MAG: ABC transporter substrate-binding protein [Williamsia sp.]|nr:ABC transporter substrate-binding protein [Williamsia sp.]